MQAPRPSRASMSAMLDAFRGWQQAFGAHFWFCERAAELDEPCTCGMDTMRQSIDRVGAEHDAETVTVKRMLGE